MRKSVSILLLGFFLLVAQPVSAAESTFFGPIVPTQCQSCPCGFAGVLEVARHLMNFAITFGVIVLTIMIAYGGLMYILSVANPENRRQANSLITGAVIGMVLILSSWLIVDFVMRSLYSGPDGTEGKFGPWNSILATNADWCIVAKQTKPLFDSIPFSPNQGPSTNPTNPSPNPNPVTPSPIVGNEAVVRKQFSNNRISINKSPCPSGTRYQDVSGGCTTVGGLRENTVAQTINLKNICGSIVVTGGNELGHSDGGQSHTTGYKIDLSTGIDSCISGGSGGYFTRNGSRGSNARYIDKCGNEYVRESSHWDITVTKVCAK